MNKKILKNLVAFAMLVFLAVPMMTLAATGTSSLANFGAASTSLNLGASDPETMVTKIINTALGFLGLIAVIIILLGGFKWMTAGGAEDKVSEAKKLLGAGIIGLVIIIAAWGIAGYVIKTMVTTSGGT